MSDDWWVLTLFMYLFDEGFEDRLRHEMAEQDADGKFREWASGCTYLELDNDGRATERICHHPTRDDQTDWILCDRRACPFMTLNAPLKERGRCDLRLTMESTDACCRCKEGTDAD